VNRIQDIIRSTICKISVVKKSEKLIDLLLSETDRIDGQQQNLSSHIDSLVNISIQTKMEKMTVGMISLTIAIFVLKACALAVAVLTYLSSNNYPGF
jgi:hypothetical protein